VYAGDFGVTPERVESINQNVAAVKNSLGPWTSPYMLLNYAETRRNRPASGPSKPIADCASSRRSSIQKTCLWPTILSRPHQKLSEVSPMFHRILVPLDGSSLAERALPVAAGLAGTSGGSLTLIRAAPPSANAFVLRTCRHYLDERAAEFRRSGLEVEVGVVLGDPAAKIVAAARRYADLVVMATHARFGPDLWIHGSVAERVIRLSPVPVLLLRASAVRNTEIPRKPLILVPLDGTPLSESALPVAQAFARQLAGEMLLVRAVELPPWELELAAVTSVDLSRDIDTLSKEAADYLEAVSKRLRAQGYSTRFVIEAPPTVAVLLEAVRVVRPALVVMATHARAGLARLAFGSVTSSIVHDGRTPVVAVPPGAMHAPPPEYADAASTQNA
jgi:nucleotide-binding universal stress UspA family protein